MMTQDALAAALLAAHERGDGGELARLYLVAGKQRDSEGALEAACFFFTHAYVHALEQGLDDIAAAARARLIAHGREE